MKLFITFELKLNLLLPKWELNFAFSQISAHASSAWHHPNTLVPIPIWDFYFDISEWHILSMRAWTPALMLHLTNPCAKQKVFSLTKPKGKIYKTKSLGNYITIPGLEPHHQMHFRTPIKLCGNKYLLLLKMEKLFETIWSGLNY